MELKILWLFCVIIHSSSAQNLGQGYIANDLNANTMQALNKPNYLSAVADPAFTGTAIRRITDAGTGNFNKPMYSTIQAWNADESLMIVYAGGGNHSLLDGQDILDQELFIAKTGVTSAVVYRVAHHRYDETEFDYWGEPHVTISPSGTRLLFGSDWSGTEDGDSVDAYVAELFSHTLSSQLFENTL